MQSHKTEPRIALRWRHACRLVLVASFALYVWAWFLPSINSRHAPEGRAAQSINGGFAFMQTMMMLCVPPSGKTGWLTWKLMGLTGASNFIVPFVIPCMANDRYWVSVGCSLVAFGLLDLLWMYWLPQDGCLGSGYYAWLSSIWLLGLTCLASALARSMSTPRSARPNTHKAPRSQWKISDRHSTLRCRGCKVFDDNNGG